MEYYKFHKTMTSGYMLFLCSQGAEALAIYNIKYTAIMDWCYQLEIKNKVVTKSILIP